MPAGPGKYDDLCTAVRTAAHAQAAIVIVIGGNRGSGFSVQTWGEDVTAQLPPLLRNMADEIERSIAAGAAAAPKAAGSTPPPRRRRSPRPDT